MIKNTLLSPSPAMLTRWLQVALLSAASWALPPAAQAQTSWNAYNDFYLSPTAAGWTGATNGTVSAWGYYAANVNGFGFPTQIGTYMTPTASGSGTQNMYQYSSTAPIGAGTYVGSSGWSDTGGRGFAYYGDTFNWGSSLGSYPNPWFGGAPGLSQGLSNLIWMQAGWLGGGESEGIASVVTWKAPSTGSYLITGQFVSGDQPGNGASVAIVDSRGGALLGRTSLSNNAVNRFSYFKNYSAGDVVQFQVGTDFKAGNAVGLQVDIKTSTWSAYKDFYLSPPYTGTNAPGWQGATNGTGSPWGYYMGNVNGGANFPTSIGNYLNSGQIYKLSDSNPGGASDPTKYSTSGWVDTGGAGFPSYADNLSWGVSLGRYDTPWFPGAPGLSQGLKDLIWMQAGWLGVTNAEGIAPVLTWKAPDTGTYVVTGRFVSGDDTNNRASVAIVDSRGIAKLARTSLSNNTVQDFSFTNTYGGGEVLQFQVGTDYKTGNAVGLEVGMEKIVSSSASAITNWNAARDFYLSPTAGGWGGATYPSEAGSAWSYYAANVNGYGLPNQIGTYFTPQSSGFGSQNLYPYFGFDTLWDATGGLGFARYRDNQGWGSSLGFFAEPWFSGAPGNTTDARGGIWMQAGYLSNSDPDNGGPAEGIAPVLTWTAPRSGIYDFQGSFLVAANGVGTALENSGASIAIVASTESAPILSNTNATQGMDYPFVFRKKLNQGDVIQFQVGTAFKTGAAVGLSADVTRVGDINQIVPSAVILFGPNTLAYANPGTELKPALAILGSGSSNSPTPTYSYEGVDGTIYSSLNAPTLPGRYEVTATISANTNNHPWAASTNKIRYSVGTFNAFKDFRWNRTNGQADWKGATTMNAWSYGSMDCEGEPITAAGVDQKFRALSGASHNPGNSSYSYVHATNFSNRISWIAANSNSAVLALRPGGGSGGGLASALRWTAPAAGTYRFQGKFEPQNSSSMSVAIQTIDDADPSDNTQFPTSGTGTVFFDVTTNVLSGQKVTWVAGGPAGDVMNLSVDVSQVVSTSIPPTITSTNGFSGTVGVAFSNNITASGDAPIGFSGAGLPGGLSVAAGGAITGTPTAAGTFSATLTATNAAGTTNQTATFTIAKGTQSLVLGSLSLASISAGSTTTVTASGGSGTGAYEFRQNGGTGSVGFTGTGDSRTINTIADGTAFIEVRRVADANYEDSSWVSAGTLTVTPAAPADSSFSGWLGANPSSAALLVQYAYGAASASSTVNRSNLPAMTLSNSNLMLTYYVRKNATNPNLVTPEVHTNLAVSNGWANVPAGSITTLGTNTVDGVQVIQRRASVPVDGSRKFLRLKIAE